MRRILAASTLALALSGLIAIVPAAPASASCGPDLYLIAARGSGESPQADLSESGYSDDVRDGLGKVLFPFSEAFTALARTTGHSVEVTALRYPAVAISFDNVADRFTGRPGSYEASVAAGAKTLRSLIATLHEKCSTTRFVLAGYSQGAETISRGIDLLTRTQKSLIASTVLFGDPFFNPSDHAADEGSYDPEHFGFWGRRPPWQNVIASPVRSYCRAGDIVCNVGVEPGDRFSYLDLGGIGRWILEKGGGLFTQHESYASGGDVHAAVQRLAVDLSFAPSSGSARGVSRGGAIATAPPEPADVRPAGDEQLVRTGSRRSP